MATKSDGLFLKDHFHIDCNNDGQFANLNLNQNHKCLDLEFSRQSYNKSNFNKNYELQQTNITAEIGAKRNAQKFEESWKKSMKNGLCFKNFKDGEFGEKTEGKKPWMNDCISNTTKSSSNNSTLSLHISAYENNSVIEASTDKIDSSKKSKDLKILNFSPNLQDPFEYPRQMDNNKHTVPQVMQFKASQKLLNPNQAHSEPLHPTESLASLHVREKLSSNSIQLQNKILGKGSYSKVLIGNHQGLGKQVAVKQIDLRQQNEYIRRFMPRELKIIERLKHPNIAELYQIIRTKNYICMIQELAPHGDMLKLIKAKKRIDEPESQFLFRQLIEGLKYLEALKIVHRDLKCENLLLDDYDNLKIADFGFARVLKDDEESHTFCGSRAYVAHEIMMSKAYRGNGVDIWGSGVILYIMLNGVMPFDDRGDTKVLLKQQQKRDIPFSRKVSKPARELILSMLHPSPDSRATIQTILSSQWLDGTRYFMRGIIEEDNTCSTASQISETQLRRLHIDDE